MRDHPAHTAPMMGGMWGARVAGDRDRVKARIVQGITQLTLKLGYMLTVHNLSYPVLLLPYSNELSCILQDKTGSIKNS